MMEGRSFFCVLMFYDTRGVPRSLGSFKFIDKNAVSFLPDRARRVLGACQAKVLRCGQDPQALEQKQNQDEDNVYDAAH